MAWDGGKIRRPMPWSQVLLADVHIPQLFRQARGDEGEAVLRIAGGLDVVRAVHIHHVEAALRHAVEVMHVRGGVVGGSCRPF